MDQKYIRNFSIIAHVDHGKSTLADRILEHTSAITDRQKKAQFLDNMDLERERGITIKAQTVRLTYKALDGQEYILNLIDTPGHVDFTYEVSRSLAACEGALLVVDAAQGVEAQTLANCYLAIENDLEIIPVLNKIDLPTANPEAVCQQIEQVIGLDTEDIVLASAKEDIGTAEILERLVQKIPPPTGDPESSLRALVFDSWFDSYLGTTVLIRIIDGHIKKGMRILFMSSGETFDVTEVGTFSPTRKSVGTLGAGDVGYMTASIKDLHHSQVGDTITDFTCPAEIALKGFRPMKPMVFSGIFPVSSEDYPNLKDALEKLILNDSALSFEPETSNALGFGFRCGFLGMLHMEIVQERLEREYKLELITTAPSVAYKVVTRQGESFMIDNPTDFPDTGDIERIEEPMATVTIFTPSEYLGNIFRLCEGRRGKQDKLEYVAGDRVLVAYRIPFSEMVFDFYDRLKSATRGYASIDYEVTDFVEADLVKLNIMVNGDPVDALSAIIHRENAFLKGRDLTLKLKRSIPRQMFEVALQASVGGRVVARETVKAMRKNVTAKCYGGDITRKRKLLEKQKAGKKRMKHVGNVEIPQEAFLAILKLDDN